MEINRTKIDYTPRSQYIKNGSAGTSSSSSSVTTTDNSALAYINNLFTYDAENQAIKANYNLYGIGEISAYGLGSTTSGGTGGFTDEDFINFLTANGYSTSALTINYLVSGGTAAAIDTLNELSTALGNDPNFATTITNVIGTKWTQDNTKISNWDLAFTNTHTHTNKPVLDSISTTNVSNWNTAYSNNHVHSNISALNNISDASVLNWNTAYTNNHTHSNLSALSGITSTNVTNWNTAFTNNHTHANLSVLSGITSTNITTWNTAYSLTSHTHTFESLTSRPTTLSGYGITDASLSTHTHTFESLTSRPTTLSGYGITDAAPMASLSATLPATVGWYRVATSAASINRCSGRFEISWKFSGYHGQSTINAGIMYGQDPTLNLIHYSHYGVSLSKTRIVYHTAYTGNYAYLEVYNSIASAVVVNVQLFSTLGWTLVTPSTTGSIPAGYTSQELDFIDGISTEGQLVSRIATGTAPLIVNSSTMISNLNAQYLGGSAASAFSPVAGSSSIVTVGTVTAGTWNASTIAVAKGGLNLTSIASGYMLYASAANVYSTVVSSAFGRSLLNSASGTMFTGLNADLLDGKHSSYFIDTSETSQTKSGALTIGGNLTCSGNVLSTYYMLNNTSTNPYLKLIQGSTYYIQAYTGNLYLGTTVTNSLAVNSLGDVTVNGNAFNMLNLRCVNANGSSILFSNLSGNLGKLGFNSLGSFMVGTGNSTDGAPNLINITSGGTVSFYGNVSTSGEITAYSASDIRLKSDIQQLTNSLDIINKLNPVSYRWNDTAKSLNPNKNDGEDYGLIAQELEDVLPNLVHNVYDKYKSIDYVKLVPFLVAGMKEQQLEIENLKKQIDKLSN